ncbi:MAG TPA: DUF4910 domain-containing protein [bacterium (Candidatus Stahlbacteria)]|nr:DUF4910 domain-containing protein [Candidatus Stahlbacteria bacterium]
MLRIFNDLEAIKSEYSGETARGYVGDITRFHRIQASPGIRAAAKYCYEQLKQSGLKARTFRFPADGKRRFWSLVVPEEWKIEKGVLMMLEPKRLKLCDYGANKLSVIQRTAPFKGSCELVVLEDGEEIEEYRRLDLRGKAVLTRGDIGRVYQLAVLKHGAVGIIYDGMRKISPVRDRFDLVDAYEYRSFWWQKGERRCFGFVLTPRQGEMVRGLAKKKKVKFKVDIKSKFYRGQIEVVSGLIPGRNRKEIVVLSHLCHPQPSANDNGSGCGASLEIARTIKYLIGERKLRRPKWSIRFLYLPEMTGTYAYLASDERRIRNIIAGINLDMVGENQDLCGSSLLLESPPMSNPSFVRDLLSRLLREFSQDTKGFGGTGGYPLFRYAQIPFSGGSDHYILSDPTIGIPCPMLIQWPDKFYHTSFDTLDKVDPKMLFKAGSLACSYVYFLAQAGVEEVAWLKQEMTARTRIRLLEMINDWETDYRCGKEKDFSLLKKKVRFYLDRRIQSLKSLRKLANVKIDNREIKRYAKNLLQKVENKVVKKRIKQLKISDEWERRAKKLIPKRIYKGPPSVRSYFHKLSDTDKEKFHKITSEGLVWDLGVKAIFWSDGKRTLKEIADLVELESGRRNMKFLVGYFEILEKMGLIRIRKINR